MFKEIFESGLRSNFKNVVTCWIAGGMGAGLVAWVAGKPTAQVGILSLWIGVVSLLVVSKLTAEQADGGGKDEVKGPMEPWGQRLFFVLWNQ